jgi:hypothetical protein
MVEEDLVPVFLDQASSTRGSRPDG